MPEPRVLIPQSLPDLLSVTKRRPDCLLYAGGTWIGTQELQRLNLRQRDVILLQRVEELTRVYRTDHYLDIGAMVTLDKLARLQREIVPPGLHEAILSTVPSPARNLATIGGNLAIPTPVLNLLPWFACANARVELKKLGSVRLEPASFLMGSDGDLFLEPSEFISKIRVPLSRWNHWFYRRVEEDAESGSPRFAVCGFAELHGDNVSDLRIAVVFSNVEWYADCAEDADLIGQRLPIEDREIDRAIGEVRKRLRERGRVEDPILIGRLSALLASFLHHLPKGLD